MTVTVAGPPTAEHIRGMIVAHDAARPRSQQTAIGPSDLSSPCDRRLVLHLQEAPRVAQQHVNLYAWVGTQIHNGMEKALKHDNEHTGRRWLTETRVSVPVTDDVSITGSCDAYDAETFTCIDWKSRGATKPGHAKRDKHHAQILPYGLGLILRGHRVDFTAVVYIPRNGKLDEIEVDARPFDHEAAEQLLRRYEALIKVAAAGPAVLPLIPTADDCIYCPWWNPNAWIDGQGCAGHDTPKTPGPVPVEHHTTQPEKVTTQP